tara:strand:- start:2189 stop:3010 length:822 start_codon:yes stop_codon:yes gene_type:complete
MNYLNIACGNIYITDNKWTNIDFTTNSPDIKKADLLKGLPFKDKSFDVVYSSHFIEHIPKDQVNYFLAECYRVLKPKGVIRLITPDLEFLSKEYINHNELNDFEKSNLVSELLFDQCVRLNSGGNLARLINKIKNSDNNELKNYTMRLLGNDIFYEVYTDNSHPIIKIVNRLKQDPKIIFNIISMIWIRTIVALLPKSFRNTNVSLASIGEKHMWVYDFSCLSKYLEAANFSSTSKSSFETTIFREYIFKDLDAKNALPRKGSHQLFIEAIKN